MAQSGQRGGRARQCAGDKAPSTPSEALGQPDLEGPGTALLRLADTTRIPMAHLDAALRLVGINRACAQVLGRSPESCTGRSWTEVFPQSGVEALLRRVIDRGQPHRLYARPFGRPGTTARQTRYWDWIMTPVGGNAGVAGGLVLCLLDVTRHARARQALVAELSLAEEHERRRLANELHDDALQTLAAAKLKLEMLGEHLNTAAGVQLQRQAVDLLAQTGAQLRALTRERR
jgi:signal transduction histidine kinase